MNIRLLAAEDRAQAKALWQSTFDDPISFVDWFFENRYVPEWSVGVFDGRELVSVIHGTPMELSLGNGSFEAIMTSGVATVPQARGQGHMHDAMRFLQAYAEKRGVRALFNHPEQPGTYARLGFRPSSFTKYWQGEGTLTEGTIRPFYEEEAYRVYSTISLRYTGFVRRDMDAFRLKMADYASAGAKGYLLEEGGNIVGYCVYFEGDTVYGEEVLSLSGYGPLLYELKNIAGNRRAEAKLPPDADAAGEIKPQNVMLAPDRIWEAMRGDSRPWFCVDEY